MITITNEEYNAILEAREELVNEAKEDIKAHYAARRAAELDSNKAGHNKFNMLRKKDGRDYKAHFNHSINKDNAEMYNSKGNNAKYDKEGLAYAVNKANRTIDKSKNTRELYADRDFYINPRGLGGYEIKYKNSNDRKRERKATMKEACIEYCLEEGIDITVDVLADIEEFVANELD